MLEERGVARLVGPSGIGKSRLTLEALGATGEEEVSGRYLSDLVLYTVEGEADPSSIKATVQNLTDAGVRAIVVVDRCSPETHVDLMGMVTRRSSRLSLVTIDDDPVAGDAEELIRIGEAPLAVVESIINRLAPGIDPEDQRRLVRFSRGYPRIAILVGQSWAKEQPIGQVTDEGLAERTILGRRAQEPVVVAKSARLLAAFAADW